MPPTDVHSEGITDDYSVTITWSSPVTDSPQLLSGYTATLAWTQPVVFHDQPSTLSNTETENLEVDENNNEYSHTFYGIQPYTRNCLTIEAVYSYDNAVLAASAAPTRCFNSSSSGTY